MTGKIMPLRDRDTSTVQAAADAFLSSPRYANLSTRRGYTGVLDPLLAGLGGRAACDIRLRGRRLEPEQDAGHPDSDVLRGAERRAIVDPVSLPFARRVTPQRVP